MEVLEQQILDKLKEFLTKYNLMVDGNIDANDLICIDVGFRLNNRLNVTSHGLDKVLKAIKADMSTDWHRYDNDKKAQDFLSGKGCPERSSWCRFITDYALQVWEQDKSLWTYVIYPNEFWSIVNLKSNVPKPINRRTK